MSKAKSQINISHRLLDWLFYIKMVLNQQQNSYYQNSMYNNQYCFESSP